MFAILIAASCAPDPSGVGTPPTIFSANTPQNTDGKTQSAAPATPAPPTPEPGMPDRLGLYINDGGSRKLVEISHKTEWTAGQDIKCYEAIASREATLTGSGFAEIWNACWNKFSNTKEVKIGYGIELVLKSGETAAYDVKSPEDTQKNREYVETYLYDDVHQTPGQWYSHLESADMGTETIATSIKLTAGSKIGDIERIHLTAYLYTAELPQRRIAQCGIDLFSA